MLKVNLLIERSAHSLNRPFTYLYDEKKKLGIGYRVLLDFNKQELVGYVLSCEETTLSKEELENELGYTLSFINDVLDSEPLLNDDLFNLCDEVSEYYLAPKIAVLQAMLPPSLSPRRSSLNAPKIAYEQYIILLNDNEEGLTAKQIEILRFIKDQGKVLKKDIKSVSIVNKLLELNKIKIVFEEKRRFKVPDYEYEAPKGLTVDQQKVIDEFHNSNDSIYLLEGVTGSGKTEVYLTLSEEALKQNKSILMLVPEISLTPMMMEYFIKRFNNNVAILHSELTPAEKYDEYRKIARGECKVVIGARSAIFAPLSNIGLIILDEEHVESYKQDTSPFYHAREVAIMRGKSHHAKVILGSATPSLETRARASKGIYHLLSLPNRINKQPLPKTTIINLLDYSNIDRESYIFSLQLREAIKRTLLNKEQCILLINRRGFSTHLTCRKCGHVFKCPTCGVALTYHKKDNMLKCHHCDYVETYPNKCPKCGSTYFIKTGFGTERIEEEVKRLFPEVRTLRLDSDSAKNRNKIPAIIEQFRRKEAEILIGTQMIAKGHDFPNVTLVGVVLADIGLSMPSYRSSERAFQLITQAVGRSGRKDKKGEAIIQTYNPEHYAITLAATQNYETFYKKEMNMRKIGFYPPYSYIASVSISGKSEDLVVETIYSVVDQLAFEFQDQGVVIGPSTPYLPYQGNQYSRSAIVKYRDQNLARSILNKLLKTLSTKTQISVNIDIDPYNF